MGSGLPGLGGLGFRFIRVEGSGFRFLGVGMGRRVQREATSRSLEGSLCGLLLGLKAVIREPKPLKKGIRDDSGS